MQVYQTSCHDVAKSEDVPEAQDRATLRNRLYLGGIIASIVFHGGLLTHLLANGRLPSSVAAEKEAPAVVIEVIEAKAFERLLTQRATEAAPALSNMAASAEARAAEDDAQALAEDMASGAMIKNTASTTKPPQDAQIQMQSMVTVSDSKMHALNAFDQHGGSAQPASDTRLALNVAPLPAPRMSEPQQALRTFVPNFRAAQELVEEEAVIEQYQQELMETPGGQASQMAALGEVESWKGSAEILSGGPDSTAIPIPIPRASISFLARPPKSLYGGSSSPNTARRQSGNGANRMARWAYRERVKSHLVRHKPFGGLGSGSVSIALSLSRNGELLSAEIARSSGNPELEQAVLDAVQNAAPFPEAPSAIKQSRISYVIPYLFE